MHPRRGAQGRPAGRPACRSPSGCPAAGHGGDRLPAGPGARIAAWRSSRRPPSPSGTDPAAAAAAPRRPHPTRKWAVTGSPGLPAGAPPPRLRQHGGLGSAPAAPGCPPSSSSPPHRRNNPGGRPVTPNSAARRRGERPFAGRGTGGRRNGGSRPRRAAPWER